MKAFFSFLLAALLISCHFNQAEAQEKTNPGNQDEELGKVSWYRDYDTALKVAKTENKAVLILFQEVPGCATCRNYGHNVLTHPMMVESIENLFVPLVIFNNKGGKDKLILSKYNEPTWNNPVVRIVDASGENLVPRVAGNYSRQGLYKAMEKALQVENKKIPDYFRLYGQEINAIGSIQEKTYQMYCFWTGEKVLGAKEGVLETEAGFAGGAEVVKVKFDAAVIDEKELTKYAQQNRNTPTSATNFNFSKKDHLFYLKQTPYKYLPLTDLQKTKINSALGSKQEAEQFLSPRQAEWLKEILQSSKKTEVLYLKNIEEVWDYNS